MYNLGELRPRWRIKETNGHICPWDGEWFYHFRDGGYATIEWVEIQTSSVDQNAAILELLQEIHLPGHPIDQGFRVDGYVSEGVAVDWL